MIYFLSYIGIAIGIALGRYIQVGYINTLERQKRYQDFSYTWGWSNTFQMDGIPPFQLVIVFWPAIVPITLIAKGLDIIGENLQRVGKQIANYQVNKKLNAISKEVQTETLLNCDVCGCPSHKSPMR